MKTSFPSFLSLPNQDKKNCIDIENQIQVLFQIISPPPLYPIPLTKLKRIALPNIVLGRAILFSRYQVN